MKPKPSPDCPTCNYWVNRLQEERARSLGGSHRAVEEIRAQKELAAHLERTVHMEAANK